jgi:hypothetical protein
MKPDYEHIVLLGDSIFDNGSYTGGAPDVGEHLRRIAPAAWTVSLLAVDGSVTWNVPSQLNRLPSDATRLVLSVGGNDALQHSGILTNPGLDGTGLLDYLWDVKRRFETEYRELMEALVQRKIPITVCTIYNGNLDTPLHTRASAAVAVYNDSIYRIAGDFRVPVLELRGICTEPGDYANSIEPSGTGGRKIAEGILRIVAGS